MPKGGSSSSARTRRLGLDRGSNRQKGGQQQAGATDPAARSSPTGRLGRPFEALRLRTGRAHAVEETLDVTLGVKRLVLCSPPGYSLQRAR